MTSHCRKHWHHETLERTTKKKENFTWHTTHTFRYVLSRDGSVFQSREKGENLTCATKKKVWILHTPSLLSYHPHPTDRQTAQQHTLRFRNTRTYTDIQINSAAAYSLWSIVITRDTSQKLKLPSKATAPSNTSEQTTNKQHRYFLDCKEKNSQIFRDRTVHTAYFTRDRNPCPHPQARKHTHMQTNTQHNSRDGQTAAPQQASSILTVLHSYHFWYIPRPQVAIERIGSDKHYETKKKRTSFFFVCTVTKDRSFFPLHNKRARWAVAK